MKYIQFAFVVFLAFLSGVSISANNNVEVARSKLWSVEDNVRIARLPSVVDWDWSSSDFHVSPNGKLVAFNVLESDLEGDEVISHLRVYNVTTLREFADGGDRPQPIFEKVVAGRLSIPALSDFRWVPDSSALLFLSAETGSLAPHTWRVGQDQDDPVKGAPTASYAYQLVGVDLIAVFTALPELEPGNDGSPAHSPLTVTGRPLPEIILQWDLRGAIRPSRVTLIDWRRGTKVATIDAVLNPRVALGEGRDVLSVSPDGRRIGFAEIMPVQRRGGCWKEDLLALPPADQTFPAREHAQIAFFDLASEEVVRPFGGPVGLLSGVFGTSQVSWSPDGNVAMAPYTYTIDDKCNNASPATAPGAHSYSFSDNKLSTLIKYEYGNNKDLPYAPRKVIVGDGGKYYAIVLGRTKRFAKKKDSKTAVFQLQKDKWVLVEAPIPFPGPTDADDEFSPALKIIQGYNTPPAIYAVSSIGSKRILIDLARHARDRQLERAEIVNWTDSRGYEWEGLLALPSKSLSDQRLPLVLQTHGFESGKFFAEGPTTSMFPGRAALERGFAVLTMKENLEATFGERENEGRNVLDAYRSAIAYLNDRRLIDPTKIGAIGWSRTSYHVKYALTHAPDIFSAAVVGDGVDYGYSMYIYTVDYDGGRLSRSLCSIYGGDPWSSPEKWHAESPGYSMNNVTAPVRIEAISGANGIFSEWEFYAGLRLQRKPVDLIYYPQGAHSLVLPSERIASTQGSIDWLDFWINGVEDEDPAKSDQYARWRKMREEQCERLKDQDNAPWYCLEQR